MQFKDFEYKRPNIQEMKSHMEELSKLVGENQSLEVEVQAVRDYFTILDEFDTLENLVAIRNSVDTTDKFYEEEMDYFNEISPLFQESNNAFNKKLIASKHLEGLKKEFGALMFKQIEVSNKTFKPEIIPDLQAENKLATEYQKLLASAKIEFEGGVYNLTQMAPFMQSKDRETRHKATNAYAGFLESKEAEIDRIYDELVKIRTKIAKTLGYENFVQLGYDRLGRTDYGSVEVKSYRDQVYETVVPVYNDLVKRQAKRIKIEDLKSYDLSLQFLSGNPTPKGGVEWSVNKAKKMYEALSEETGKFFNRMIEFGVLELETKPGKSGGGYCTFIPKYDTPYIFANFNGTQHDVEVLTHEAGHAFQVYQSRNLIPPYRWATYEASEIHSMSMEFLTWPWMNEFFLEDTDKFMFNHLQGAIRFLPYGVAVDEFQHGVYENPELTPDERKALWRSIEKKYLPAKVYDNEFLNKGTFWFRQGHIFSSPFYYIDYTLAQVCAFQYWNKANENHQSAFDNYLSLCKLGGSYSFTGLLEQVGLKNPFKKGSIKEIMDPITKYLNDIDDSKL